MRARIINKHGFRFDISSVTAAKRLLKPAQRNKYHDIKTHLGPVRVWDDRDIDNFTDLDGNPIA